MFDHPDLVAQLVPYLTPKDMAHCIATCKAFASIFEPYLYRQVILIDRDPVMSALPQHLQHVRILELYVDNMNGCFQELAMALSSAKTTPTPSKATSASTTMINLRKFTVNTTNLVARAYSQVALDTTISVLDNNSGLTHLELQMYTDLPGSSIDPRLLDVLRTGLPRLQTFIVSGGRAFPIVQAMEALKICLGHPSLTDAQFYTHEEREQYSRATESIDQAHLDSFLEFLNGFNQAGQQLQRANGCRLKSLALPYIEGGYPRSFLLPLLRTCLTQLERFEVPFLDEPYERELEEVVAGRCRDLQHVSYAYPSNWRKQTSNVIKAVIRGCGRWTGLKSIRIFGLNDDSSCGLLETLMEHHSKTLESVEFDAYDYVDDSSPFGSMFAGCPNLKSLKLSLWAFIKMPGDPWVFQGLRELHLHFNQEDQYTLDIETAKEELEAGDMLFKNIGKLIHLEILAFRFCGPIYNYTSSEWDLDEMIEAKWVKELVGLDKLRHLSMPSQCWEEDCLSEIIDSSWPRLESVTDDDGFKLGRRQDRCFQWLKLRRPWLRIGGLGWRTQSRGWFYSPAT
ncbi:MAG: hypothetical protein J3Q66DRAFT_330607 [Benniella sp.]|nr:MAG: hypothetical protein J3Q66DRAFT_330607 [Benniella sp.]